MPGILDPGEDIVLWAHRVGPDSGGSDVGTKESARVEWQVFVSSPTATYYDIVRSPKLPQLGEALYEYAPPLLALGPHGYPVVESALYSYVKGDLLNDSVAVINYNCQQSKENPFLWSVTVVYEGVTDPTAIPAEFYTEEVPYEVYENFDIYGGMVTNSAFDPILGGMPRDETYKMLRIVRAIPYDQWNARIGEEYKNTLNALPFVLSRQVQQVVVPDPDNPPDGTMIEIQPVVFPPGTVRIKKIIEGEVLRTANPSALDRKWHWQVSCELHVDLRTIRLPNGQFAPTLHRYVVADMGYHEFRGPDNIYKERIRVDDATHTLGASFLDGFGHAIKAPPNPPQEFNLVAGGEPPTLTGTPDYYGVAEGNSLTVSAPGVMWNDPDLPGGTEVELVDAPPAGDTAAFTLNADGSFNFTPAANVAPKWVTFRYRLVNGGDESLPIPVHILVNELPRFRAFDRYRYADWTPLAPLLANW